MSYELDTRTRVSRKKIGKVRSRNNFPCLLKYNGVGIMISPRSATMEDIDFSLLENPLPKGLVFIEN